MQRFKTVKLLGLLSFFFIGVSSCNKILDVKPGDVLVDENMYQNVYDADAAIMGIYGKLMKLSETYVVLNELRADLTSVTTNATNDLVEINEHRVTANNAYANPRPFYEVILSCNDVLKNFTSMRQQNKLNLEQYSTRYSDVMAVRSWVYLQLGIHFGSVPYVTDAIETVKDVRNLNNAPKISFDALLTNLIADLTNVPYLAQYPAGTSLVTTVDGWNTEKFFINKKVLLAQLHLWKNNYLQAATLFKEVLDGGGATGYDQYRIRYADVIDHNDLSVGYTRYFEWDENSLVNTNTQGWRSIFARGQDAIFNWEWVWFLPFSKDFAPTNPFIDLFSNRGGKYLLKPSQFAIDYWNSQEQKNNFPYDARGKKFTWQLLDGQPVVVKYLYNYLDANTYQPIDPLAKNGKWLLYRAAAMNLEYSEAANRDGYTRLAYALTNSGININGGSTYQTPEPYRFDARIVNTPTYRGPWHRNIGIRGRAMLKSDTIPTSSVADSVLFVENQIIREGALELAYEGKRWPDLLRVALRRNDASFLADKVYQKLLREGNGQAAAVRNKLMNRDNWYLPFRLY